MTVSNTEQDYLDNDEIKAYYSGTSCIDMLKDVIKVSLLQKGQKGQNDRITNIVCKLSLLQEVVTQVTELRKRPYCMTIYVCP
jgi:hypothetical protein